MLRKCISIGIGGSLGAICRFSLDSLLTASTTTSLPYGTLLINLLGCFALGFSLSLGLELLGLTNNIKLGLTTGFIGSFTTFSALEVQILQIINHGSLLAAFSYLFLSVALGYVLSCLGIKLGQVVPARRKDLIG